MTKKNKITTREKYLHFFFCVKIFKMFTNKLNINFYPFELKKAKQIHC